MCDRMQMYNIIKLKLSEPCKSNNELGSVVPIVGALVIGNRYVR
jgi:hypothetical protein